MKRFFNPLPLFLGFWLLLYANSTLAQQKEIPPNQLPANVKAFIDQYLNALSSGDFDLAAKKVAAMAAPSLLNGDRTELAYTVLPYGFKKDFNNAQYYKKPVVVTRVLKDPNGKDGFSDYRTTGVHYKVWIAKRSDIDGMPAPINVMVLPNGTLKLSHNLGNL